jgi:hypothetical protein
VHLVERERGGQRAGQLTGELVDGVSGRRGAGDAMQRFRRVISARA